MASRAVVRQPVMHEGAMSARSDRSNFITGANALVLAFLVAMVLPAMFAFGGGDRALEVFGAVAVLAALALGIPAALRRVARHEEQDQGSALGDPEPPRTVETESGRLGRKQALVQMLIVPVAAFVAMLLIAVVGLIVLG